MSDRSSRTTGNDPVEGVDPGGTRSTRPGKRKGEADTEATRTTHQTVTTGDENEDPKRQPD